MSLPRTAALLLWLPIAAAADAAPEESLRPVARADAAPADPAAQADAAAQDPVSPVPRPVARSDADAPDAPAAPGETAPAQANAEPLTAEMRPAARDDAALRPLALAMDAMRAGDWETAMDRAAGDGPIAEDILRWHALRAGRGTAQDAMAFLDRNPDWPGLPYLKEQMEPAMISAAPADVLRFFQGHAPRTGLGAMALAEAEAATDQPEAAQATIITAWRHLALEAAEQRLFLSRHGDLLAPHHAARLDATLWKGWTTNPRRMEELVSEDQWALARARMSLRQGGRAGDVPEALADHPGLAYARYRNLDGAAARRLLLERSTSVQALGRPEVWAPSRRPMARQLMRNGDLETAYRVASTHFTTTGRDFADLEWLSGYLALRLGRPEQALAHFERFRADVFTPISVGRAGYWLGRAHDALGDEAAARDAYALGARYQTSFYGLLAAEAAGRAFPGALRGAQPEADWRDAAFTRSSVHQAAVLLLAAGEARLAERFWTHLAESQDAEALALMGKMLDALGQPHIQVMLGKRAARAGLEIAAPYYALHPIAEARWPVPTELVLAIARRESEFDPAVESPAGALGLMQVMPATAREVAGDLGLRHSQARLTSDPAYNARLGVEYLRQMSLRYDGNPVLISIAYNAGPGRADRWQTLYGDPRARGTDIVDWIEGIPFRETRNYVMRVAESLPVYRARLGLDPLPQPFSELLTSSALRPRAVEGE
jgi:soluble lytic murein transglycosylase